MLNRLLNGCYVSCCALVVTSGCAPVGPNHKTPAMELPAAFSQGGIHWKRQMPTAAPRPQRWWRLYQDAALTTLVERALEQNQQIAASVARLRQAREMSISTRSLLFPSVNLGVAAERSKQRLRAPSGGTNQSNNFSVPLDFRYEIDFWGKVRRRMEAANASADAAGETLAALRLSIAGEVTQTYWALRAVDADRAVLSRTLEIRRRALDLLGKRREAGSISGLDLARAETEVATAEADRIRLDQNRIPLVNALAVLTGTVATGMTVAEQTDLPQPPGVPVSVPSEMLRQRPDIRAAEQSVVAANANIGVASAAFYPSISINGSTGFDATSIGNLFQASSLVWSLGADATRSITNYKWLKAEREAAVAAHAAASAEYRQTVLESIREVENALQGAAILKRRQAAEDQALDAARRTFELSAKRYKAGLVSFLDVVDAERTRLAAEQTANAIRADRLAISVALIKALGGEW